MTIPEGTTSQPVKWSFVLELPPTYEITGGWGYTMTSLGNNRYSLSGADYNNEVSNGVVLESIGMAYSIK